MQAYKILLVIKHIEELTGLLRTHLSSIDQK
jgi:hypothetical protein